MCWTGPLFNQRADIVAGKGVDGDGVPGFWLHALQNHDEFANLVCWLQCRTCQIRLLLNLLLLPETLLHMGCCQHSIPNCCVTPIHHYKVICLLPQITDKDAPVLHHLTDISSQDSEKGGFKLVFRFAKNDYFDHETLVRLHAGPPFCARISVFHHEADPHTVAS